MGAGNGGLQHLKSSRTIPKSTDSRSHPKIDSSFSTSTKLLSHPRSVVEERYHAHQILPCLFSASLLSVEAPYFSRPCSHSPRACVCPQAVCSGSGVAVCNFTTSFADGRALCLLISHYLPALLPPNDIFAPPEPVPLLAQEVTASANILETLRCAKSSVPLQTGVSHLSRLRFRKTLKIWRLSALMFVHHIHKELSVASKYQSPIGSKPFDIVLLSLPFSCAYSVCNAFDRTRPSVSLVIFLSPLTRDLPGTFPGTRRLRQRVERQLFRGPGGRRRVRRGAGRQDRGSQAQLCPATRRRCAAGGGAAGETRLHRKATFHAFCANGRVPEQCRERQRSDFDRAAQRQSLWSCCKERCA